jgi:hypothetical protein
MTLGDYIEQNKYDHVSNYVLIQMIRGFSYNWNFLTRKERKQLEFMTKAGSNKV